MATSYSALTDQLHRDPAASFWLKQATLALQLRDPLDAYQDAQVLFILQRERLAELGIKPAVCGTGTDPDEASLEAEADPIYHSSEVDHTDLAEGWYAATKALDIDTWSHEGALGPFTTEDEARFVRKGWAIGRQP
jgi:hypothetical protein